MLFLGFVLILTVEEKWLSMSNKNLHDCIHISIPEPLRFGHLCNRKTRQLYKFHYRASSIGRSVLGMGKGGWGGGEFTFEVNFRDDP